MHTSRRHEKGLCACARVVHSTSAARSAHGVGVQRSMGADGNAIADDESRKALHGECSKTKSAMPDTMGMVSTDEDGRIRSDRPPRLLWQWGAPVAGGPVAMKKRAM